MPSSISAVQQGSISSGFLDVTNESKENFEVFKGIFNDYGKLFLQNLGKFANQKKVVASGKLLTESNYKIDGNVLKIYVPYYYDFPNEGVQGVKSSKNAPGSPYKFKNYGMSAEGRASIKQYIASGKAKIETARKTKDKALGIGLEKKRLSVADVQANTLIYLIKRFGVKKTGYFADAVNATFNQDFELKMTEVFAKQIVFTIEKVNR